MAGPFSFSYASIPLLMRVQYMRALAERRRSRGLAASCVDFGMILGIGIVNRESAYEAKLRKSGLIAISEQDFLEIFTEAILAGRPDSECAPCFSTGLEASPGDAKPSWYNNPRFAHLRAVDSAEKLFSSAQKDISVRDKVKDSDSMTEKHAILVAAFSAWLKLLLLFQTESINAQRSLVELGVDSLNAIEIRGWFLKEVEFNISVVRILGGITIETGRTL